MMQIHVDIKEYSTFSANTTIFSGNVTVTHDGGPQTIQIPGFGFLELECKWSSRLTADSSQGVPCCSTESRGSSWSMSKPPVDVHKLSVNVPKEVVNMLIFLKEVDRFPSLYLNRTLIREAARRYEKVWLPMLYELDAEVEADLVPPLDIEWVWHLHMLAPYWYEKDCARVLANMRAHPAKSFAPSHQLKSTADREKGQQKAEAMWKKRCPDEPWEPPNWRQAPLTSVDPGPQTGSLIAYDLVQAAERQMAFLPQVSLPHYQDKQFLAEAHLRYQKHLELKRLFPEAIFVPTYDIDVCWHAHMLNPKNYKDDTIRIIGKMLNHDDSMNDRSEGSDLNVNWSATVTAWKNHLQTEVFNPGGMLRGVYTAKERLCQPEQMQAIKAIERLAAQTDANKMVFGFLSQRSLNGVDLFNDLLPQDSSTFHGCTFHEGTLRQMLGLPEQPSVHPVPNHELLNQLNIKCVQTSGVCAVVKDPSQMKDSDPLQTVYFTSRSVHCTSNNKPAASYAELTEVGNCLPLATAQLLPLSNLPMDSQVLGKIPSYAASKLPVLIRVGGDDHAVLMGSWVGVQKGVPGRPGRPGIPGNKDTKTRGVKGTRGVPGRPGNPGWLELTYFGLTSQNCGWRQVKLIKGQLGHPPSYKIAVRDKAVIAIDGLTAAYSEVLGSLDADQERCKPTHAEVAILTIAVGLLHAMLMPPAKADGVNIGYPVWTPSEARLATSTIWSFGWQPTRHQIWKLQHGNSNSWQCFRRQLLPCGACCSNERERSPGCCWRDYW